MLLFPFWHQRFPTLIPKAYKLFKPLSCEVKQATQAFLHVLHVVLPALIEPTSFWKFLSCFKRTFFAMLQIVPFIERKTLTEVAIQQRMSSTQELEDFCHHKAVVNLSHLQRKSNKVLVSKDLTQAGPILLTVCNKSSNNWRQRPKSTLFDV